MTDANANHGGGVMRLGYFTNTYPRATDTFIQREVAGLRERGFEVHTFSVRRAGSDHDVGAEVIAEKRNTFYVLPVNPLRLTWLNLAGLLGNTVRFLGALGLAWKTARPGLAGHLWQLFYFQEALVLAAELRHRRVDHLHNHLGDASGTVTMLASRLSGIGYSITVHGPHLFFDPLHWALAPKVKHARFIVCISHFARSQMMLFSDPQDWDRLRIIHCGVDIERFGYDTPVEQGGRLLYAGRLSAEKGVPVLFESLAMVKRRGHHFHITLLGDGPDRARLEELARVGGIAKQVEFAGYTSQDGVRDALGRSDVFILPSFAEGVPVSLMEAMARGVPVIGTYVGGVVELIEPGHTGLVVPPGDPLALADAITRYLEDPDLRRVVSRQARKKVEAEFNLDTELDKLAALFRRYRGQTAGAGIRRRDTAPEPEQASPGNPAVQTQAPSRGVAARDGRVGHAQR